MTEGFESGLVKDAKGAWAQYLERVGPSIQAAAAAFDELGRAVGDNFIAPFRHWCVTLQRVTFARRLYGFSVFGVHLPYSWCKWVADHTPTRWLPPVRFVDDDKEEDNE